MGKATLSKTQVFNAAALVAGLGLGMLCNPLHAAPASGVKLCKDYTTRFSVR